MRYSADTVLHSLVAAAATAVLSCGGGEQAAGDPPSMETPSSPEAAMRSGPEGPNTFGSAAGTRAPEPSPEAMNS